MALLPNMNILCRKLIDAARCTLTITVAGCLVVLCACEDSRTQSPSAPAEPQLPEAAVQKGGVYRVPLMQVPTTLDPVYVRDRYGESVVHQVFDGLVQFGPYLSVLPALAESWQVDENGRRIRFFIRKEARFHNGRRVTAEDARYSLIRLLRVEPPPAILPHLLRIEGASAYRKRESDQVSGLQCPREGELHIQLTQPHAPLLSALAMYQASIVPAEHADSQDILFGDHPVGTGPFRFVAWDKNRLIRLKRFDGHYAGDAFLDEVWFHIYPGSPIDKVLADFTRGELEEMPFYFGIREQFSGDEAYRRIHRPSLSLLFYGLNTRHPLLQNPAVRNALSLAIDRTALTRNVYGAQFDAAHSILPPGMPGYQRLEELSRFDPASADTVFRQATMESPGAVWTLEIASGSASDFAKKELESIRQSWLPLGIELKTKFISDWSQFEQYIQSDSVQIYRYAWNADLPDPDSFLHPLFASDSPVNFSRFSDAKTDRMLNEALEMVDPVERAKKYQEIERHILGQYPIIPLFYLSIDRLYQPNVQMSHISALGAHTMPLNRVWLKTESSVESTE